MQTVKNAIKKITYFGKKKKSPQVMYIKRFHSPFL